MKKYIYMLCELTLVLLVSCNVHQPPSRASDSLKLTLELKDKKVHSIDDLRLQMVLLNQSNSSLLVQNLAWRPAAPTGMYAITIIVSDSYGNPIDQFGTFVNSHPQGEDTMSALKPGWQLKDTIYLDRGFHASSFKKGETYTIVAIYQNNIDVTKNFIEGPVSSWVGSIRSNEETFIILP